VPKVALCMQLTDFYEHGIARGVVRFAKTRPDWRLYGYGWMFRPLNDLELKSGDGIIARVESRTDADRLAALGLPLIDVAGAYARPGFRSVTNDDFLTGYKAGVHLRSCGFERFAFLGVEGTIWSEERRAGYAAALGPAASPLPLLERGLALWEDGRVKEDLTAFLKRLRTPAAIFACNDTAGLRACELAGRLGIAVPDSLAILGVDDEDILCELASPSLSSIMLDCESIGHRAASTLEAILEGGGPSPGSRVAIPPKEVAERESTRVYTCSDPLVSKAATFIRAHAHEGIGVPDLLAVLSSSRRALEVRFRAAMGRSLHDEIVSVRLARARRLLLESDRGIEEIAGECGFGALQRFHAAFKKGEGMTPGEWRRRGRPRR
jgi:LacI family transcriptional regulator